MIYAKDLLSINYYKKAPFTGSFCGMCYRIKKQETEGDGSLFYVTVWPGPYNYETTPGKLKKEKTFPFTADSLPLIADYLNGQYEENKESWPDHI